MSFLIVTIMFSFLGSLVLHGMIAFVGKSAGKIGRIYVFLDKFIFHDLIVFFFFGGGGGGVGRIGQFCLSKVVTQRGMVLCWFTKILRCFEQMGLA